MIKLYKFLFCMTLADEEEDLGIQKRYVFLIKLIILNVEFTLVQFLSYLHSIYCTQDKNCISVNWA